MPVKIFVGNLSSDTTNEDLRPLFEKFGEVTECDVLRNFGFVHMQNEDEAERAITEIAGIHVRGQRINVEKSTGSSSKGGGGKTMGRGGFRGGRGGVRGRGGPYAGGRSYEPYPPPRPRPYDRDPYEYYDRHYSQERPPPRLPPPYADERRPYEREERLPPPRDPYDRYPPPRYPPPERYPYERLPPRPADPYERPPPDYYRAYDGYDDPVGRPPLREDPIGPPPGLSRGRDAANGFDDRRPEVRPGVSDSYSSSYSSYYDRFYSKPPANGDRVPAIPPAGRQGMPPPQMGRMPPQPRPSQPSNDQQSKLQTGPIYF